MGGERETQRQRQSQRDKETETERVTETETQRQRQSMKRTVLCDVCSSISLHRPIHTLGNCAKYDGKILSK